MIKSVSTVFLAGAVALGGAAAAQASTYPQPETATVSDGTVAPGETVIFTATGFEPNSPVAITVSNETPAASGAGAAGGAAAAVAARPIVLAEVQSFAATADGNGTVSVPVTFNETGTYTLTASGTGADGEPLVVRQFVQVLGSTIATGSGTGATGGTGAGVAGGSSSRASGSGLANTGVDSAMMIWGAAGLGALGLGAASVVVARRRNA